MFRNPQHKSVGPPERNPAVVYIPTENASSARLSATLCMIASAGLMVGLGMVGYTIAPANTPQARAEQPKVREAFKNVDSEKHSPPTESNAATESNTAAESNTATESKPPIQPNAVAQRGSSPVAPVPSKQTPPRPTAPTRVRKGHVAYIRCTEATPDGTRPSGCPRDGELEKEVWRALAKLPQCEDLSYQGAADLRLVVKDSSSRWWFRETAHANASVVEELSSCLRSVIAAPKTSLETSYLLVSFRFWLES